MKKSFDLVFGEYTFTLRKQDVQFVDGYGLVKAEINKDAQLVGIVDQDYKEVLPLALMDFIPKVFIAPNGNFIFETYDPETNEKEVWHVDKDHNEYNLGAYGFGVINQDIIELHYNVYAALYNTQTKEFLTPFYHYIGPFFYSEKYQCKIASVSFYIQDENGNIINEIRTLINEEGHVLENYYDLVHSEELECKELPLVLELVKSRSENKL